jgi:MFS family permease
VRQAIGRLLGDVRTFPGRFWLLVGGTFVYLTGILLCWTYATLYMTKSPPTGLGLSMTAAGLILGLPVLVGLPMYVLGGTVADRVGRRPVLILAICGSITLCEGLALAHTLWLVVAVITFEAAFGWAMFLTANNAIIADLTPPQHRVEAFAISRTATSSGVVAGPLIGALLLHLHATYHLLFFVAGGICGLFLLMVLIWFRETKPASATSSSDSPSPTAGYRVILHDRRFLSLCAGILLPLYCFSQFQVTFPVLCDKVLGISPSTWGTLLALSALTGVLLQFPVARLIRRLDQVTLMAIACLLIGGGLGGGAYVPAGWPTAAMVLVFSLGTLLLMPVSATIVSHLAPLELRGRYMGAWTLVWMVGMALGPAVGGIAMDSLGGRGAYALIMAAGLLGAMLFIGLRQIQKPASPASADQDAAGPPDVVPMIPGELPGAR